MSDDDTINESDDLTDYDTDDEAFPDQNPANLYQVPGQNIHPGQPITLDVSLDHDVQSYLPLCLLFNARSAYNKADNLTELLRQICPDICMISESWESEPRRLSTLLSSTHISYLIVQEI